MNLFQGSNPQMLSQTLLSTPLLFPFFAQSSSAHILESLWMYTYLVLHLGLISEVPGGLPQERDICLGAPEAVGGAVGMAVLVVAAWAVVAQAEEVAEVEVVQAGEVAEEVVVRAEEAVAGMISLVGAA